MAFHQADGLIFYQFESFPEKELVHGVFTRHGGISPDPWSSLNLGGTVGDERDHVIENRRRIFSAMNRQVETIFDVWQVHGDVVIASQCPRPLDAAPQKADAILTSRPEISLFMRFADCVPILLYDPVKRVVGLVHAGWQGTVKQICKVTVSQMEKIYGSQPDDLIAGIGPSIGPDHYEIGPDVIAQVEASFDGRASSLLNSIRGKIHLDLWEANRLSLQQAGVRQIEISGICTACNVKDWYSHRAERGKTGRFGALIALRD